MCFVEKVGFEPRTLGIPSPALCQLRYEPGGMALHLKGLCACVRACVTHVPVNAVNSPPATPRWLFIYPDPTSSFAPTAARSFQVCTRAAFPCRTRTQSTQSTPPPAPHHPSPSHSLLQVSQPASFQHTTCPILFNYTILFKVEEVRHGTARGTKRWRNWAGRVGQQAGRANQPLKVGPLARRPACPSRRLPLPMPHRHHPPPGPLQQTPLQPRRPILPPPLAERLTRSGEREGEWGGRKGGRVEAGGVWG
jgi:hypothetical protein